MSDDCFDPATLAERESGIGWEPDRFTQVNEMGENGELGINTPRSHSHSQPPQPEPARARQSPPEPAKPTTPQKL